jgi:hypothetical protein
VFERMQWCEWNNKSEFKIFNWYCKKSRNGY